MAEAINTRLPASVTGLQILKFRTRAPLSTEWEQDGALDTMASSLDYARRCCDSALSARDKIMQNSMRTPLANARDASKVAFAWQQKAAEKIDRARDLTLKEIDKLQTMMRGPKPPAGAEAQEIRAAVLRLDTKTRNAMLQMAVEQNDATLLGAVLQSSTPALVGLTPAELGTLRKSWALKNHPRDLDRVERLQKAVSCLEIGGGAVTGFLFRLTPQAEIEKAELSEAAATAAMKDAAA